MPAVNPSRLEKEIDEVVLLLDEPEICARACMRLLEFYADRMKRSGSSSQVLDGLYVLNVPYPVVRQLSLRLADAVRGGRHQWEQVARTLWDYRYREAELIAISILGVQDNKRVPDIAQEWALQCDDRRVIENLSDLGLREFRSSRPVDFFEAVEGWLTSSTNRLRFLGLLSLIASLDAYHSTHMPTILRLLQAVVGNVRGESRQALYELVEDIARLSPLEMTSLILEEVKAGTPGIERVILETRSSFPPDQEQRLEDALSG